MTPEQGTRESVGGSSRDEERGTRNPRRTASSGGFLVDSFIPRSKSLRTSGQHHNLSETDHRRKRGTPEAESAPKKRSRFRWSRHRESTKESDDVGQNAVENKEEDTGSCHFAEDATVPESQSRIVSNHTAGNMESHDDQGALGLDKDSLQIVNLALNLSESRRKGNVGYNASSQVPGGTWAPSGDGRSSAAGSIPSHGSYASHSASKSLGDDRVKLTRSQASTATNDVMKSLPGSATSSSAPQGFSAGTLARAANTRRYFELRHEYLRLLPSLPPLSLHEDHSTADPSQSAQKPSHRVYNPLQAIRNRKVRFRERCPIDPEADGWNDIDKVHSWVNSVEAQYSHQTRTHLECLKLPPFQGGHVDAPSNQDVDGVDDFAASPPSSLRRISRTGSLKTRRPRSDWIIFPDELFADAAWVEDAPNKSKLTDKDGNTLYPDPSSLIVNDFNQEQAQGKSSASTGRPSSHTSHSDARQRLSVDMKDAGRGRQPRRFRVSQRIGRSSSPSGEDLGSKKRKLRIRPRSSSGSSVDVKPYRNSFLNHARSPGRSVSPLGRQGQTWNEKRGSLSSGPSADDRYDPLSLAKIEGHMSNADMDVGYFPGIASNLSPPSSRSPSPAKRGFSRAVGSRRGQGRNSPNSKGADDDSSVDFDGVRQDSMPFTEPSAQIDVEPPPLPTKASTYHVDGRRPNHHERKDSAPHESKLRGIFKGPGKIAGKVGNEVSKMGDFILKKDGGGHSRQSSFVMSDDSESSSSSDDDDDEVKGEKHGIPRAILRRLPAFSDDLGRSTPRNSDKSLAKNHSQNPPTIVEPRQLYEDNEAGPTSLPSSQGRLWDLQRDAGNSVGKHSGRRGHRFMQFGPEIHTIREEIKKGRIKDNSVPYSLVRPPITGLAQAQPTPTSSPHELRPTLPGQSRSWSISDRSVSVSIESGVPGKQEVERTRALLLSSGIKAREIVRRADNARSPPPEFLQRSFSSDTSIPTVPRIHEHQLASQRLLKRIETSHKSFEGSIERLPKDAFSPLKSQLSTLEDLVNKSLNNRVRAATEEAENLSLHLNTTSTLAVKQLSDTLEHGLRKRHRRLRWLRRTGFVMLEWALIGLLWWVWLIVVAFKLFRKLLYGMASGVRWVLWL
ncbi:uncharacterized protein APUU_40549A [Aspergillus puulaauensis]|uniref:Uncharacterized protein n=1 Tax=Aspergillus puulaauensis TaxID=1220207 RepID=A0A7R7XME6_9EURO|nr:uncharacterized protein APUU_40549A [Aspergillus puulaauensis]BCS24105.1 hypothetical protein APUU_40549A [Aspergillus puulaauensis]